ncbi:MAG: endolytic transglycosylase MltG [Lachnospiraceae bacterium]|nr:endolytic transglycosylase MltG [Lachnospiraceae bacterium]
MNARQMLSSAIWTVLKVSILALILTYVFRFASSAYDFGYRVFTEEPMTGEPGIVYSVTISEGKSVKEIGQALEQYGLVSDWKLFYVQNLLSEYKDGLMPGTYQLSTAMTPTEMMALMAGDTEETEEATN